MAYSLNDFVQQKPRVLPVIVAVDKSGSMAENGKIEAMNHALCEFVDSLKHMDTGRVELQMAIYSFGADVTCDVPLSKVDEIDIPSYKAYGQTPMGQTFREVKTLIENKEIISSRSYRPTIVLLTDGEPTDDVSSSLTELVTEGRSSKSFRIAMAIGEDANRVVLERFVSDPTLLVEGSSARDIHRFFKFVTMSVTQRTKSQNPDAQNINADIFEEF